MTTARLKDDNDFKVALMALGVLVFVAISVVIVDRSSHDHRAGSPVENRQQSVNH